MLKDVIKLIKWSLIVRKFSLSTKSGICDWTGEVPSISIGRVLVGQKLLYTVFERSSNLTVVPVQNWSVVRGV